MIVARNMLVIWKYLFDMWRYDERENKKYVKEVHFLDQCSDDKFEYTA